MFFIVSKLRFENVQTPYDAKKLAQLVEKLRSKFKISVQIADEFHKSGQAGIVLAAVHSQEMQLSHLIDDVSDICEDSGFGRIVSENTILENFESYESELD